MKEFDMYDQDQNNKVADELEAYIDEVRSLLILEDKKKKDVKKSVKIVKEAIKNLRKGKPEKVYNEERFDDYSNGIRMYDDEDDYN